MLSSLSGYSIQYLALWFHKFFRESPPELPLVDQTQMGETYLLVDGLWFGRWFVLMVYRQHKNLTILHISIAKSEVGTKITKDFKYLLDLGYRFTGIVSDDGTGIIRAIEKVFPHVPHQICLAHMHRRVVSMLGKKPKERRLIELRSLADHVWLIESQEALKWWNHKVKDWRKENWSYLLEFRRDQDDHWWYVHKGARKAINILLTLPDKSFTFLTHPLMPKTTNEIEAQFGHLAKRWLAHRGLKRERWEIFLKWFVYLYNQEKLTRSKKH